jgi:cyanophycin synthetase
LALGPRVEQIEEIFGAVKAIDAALSTLKPGDLLLLQADTIDETVDYVRRYLAENYTARETTYCEALATAPAHLPAVNGSSQPLPSREPAVASVSADSQSAGVAVFVG